MRILLRKISIALLSVACIATTQAAEWEISPTFRFKAGYDDNLRLSTDNEISSAEATFSPSAIFSVATPTSGASGTIRFDFRRFENDSDLDDNNSRVEINSFQTLERSRLGLDLGFIKDTTLDTQLEATGIAVDRVRRQNITASPNWTYSFNERTQASISYSYIDVEYLNTTDARFVNYTLNSAQTSLTRVMNEQTTTSVTLSGSRTNTDNDVKSTNINLQGGASYQFSETLSGSLFVGIRRTGTDFSQTSQIPILLGNSIIIITLPPQNVSNSSSGSTFDASLAKTFLRGRIGLTASRNISSDFNGQPIEVTRLGSTNLYRFSGTLSASLNFSFYRSKSSNDIASRLNRNYVQIEPTFIWALKKFWSLSGSYRYRKQTFKDISDDAIQNAAYLTLAYRWPRIAVSR
ncbi:MAG: hypothetical protein GXP11_06770 [Gammaproteobacteria bacterium]|nr:hypothetical protein [Gammaproteobacteria bacterium]